MKIIKTAAYKEAKQYRKITDQQIEEIVEMYKRKVPIKIIAQKYNTSGNTILKYLRSAGVAQPAKRSGLGISDETIQEIVRLYNDEDYGQLTLAKKFRLPIQHVKYILQAANVPINPSNIGSTLSRNSRSRSRYRGMQIGENLYEAVVSLSEQGLTIREIAQKTNLPSDAIMHILSQNQTRPASVSKNTEKIQRIVELFRAGYTPNRISNMMGIAPQTTQDIIFQHLSPREKEYYRKELLEKRGEDFKKIVNTVRNFYEQYPYAKLYTAAHHLELHPNVLKRIKRWFLDAI